MKQDTNRKSAEQLNRALRLYVLKNNKNYITCVITGISVVKNNYTIIAEVMLKTKKGINWISITLKRKAILRVLRKYNIKQPIKTYKKCIPVPLLKNFGESESRIF